jgi:ion channel
MFLIILTGLVMEAVIVILSAFVLVTVTLGLHVGGVALLLRWLRPYFDRPPTRLLPIALVLIRIAMWQILAHLTAISFWATFYLWQDCLPDSESAFYFAGVTYTTAGYGDLVLLKPWRLLGPIEGLTGILMCGLSASVFFAAVNHFYRVRHEKA